MNAVTPSGQQRVWRPTVLWSITIIVLLGLVFVGTRAVQIFRRIATVDSVLDDLHCHRITGEAEAIEMLGGVDDASAGVVMFLRVPRHTLPKRILAIRILGECGRPGVKELVRSLCDVNPVVRLAAAQALLRCGPEAEDAYSMLVLALDDSSPSIRALAAATLAEIGIRDNTTADSLQRKMHDDSDSLVRAEAALALSSYESRAEQAIPALVHSLTDKETGWLVRARAAYALRTLGQRASSATPALLTILKDHKEDDMLCACVIPALCNIERDAHRMVPQLMKIALVADTREPESRFAAVKGLGIYGPEAKHALPFLRSLLRDTSAPLAVAAAESVARIEPGARDAMAFLNSMMNHANVNWRICAAESLAELDPRNGKALSFFRVMLSESRGVFAATRVLGRMGSFASPAVPELIAALESTLPEHRAAAAEALGNIGPAAIVAEPDLQRHMKDTEPRVRHAVAKALMGLRGEKSER